MATISGGDKLKAKLAGIAAAMSSASSVKIGFLAGSSYPDGTPVPLVAAVQEFGAPSRGIPPRPFFRNMIADKKGEWPKAISDLLVANGYDALRTLQQTGEAVAGQLRESIVRTNSPPLASPCRRKKY